MKKIFICGLTLAATLVSALPVIASTYKFNKYIGNAYVRDVELIRIGNGTRIKVDMATPVCNGNYSLAGNVTIKYRGPSGGGWFNRSFSPKEGNGVYSVYSKYGVNVDGGRVTLSHNLYCLASPSKTRDNINRTIERSTRNTPLDPRTWNPARW